MCHFGGMKLCFLEEDFVGKMWADMKFYSNILFVFTADMFMLPVLWYYVQHSVANKGNINICDTLWIYVASFCGFMAQDTIFGQNIASTCWPGIPNCAKYCLAFKKNFVGQYFSFVASPCLFQAKYNNFVMASYCILWPSIVSVARSIFWGRIF